MRIVILLILSSSAFAGILDRLVEEARTHNSELLAAQKKLEAARQRPARERALPDPMFSAGWNSSGNPLPFAGIGREPTANVGLMASQELPAPGKLRLRGAVAVKEAEAEAAQYRATELSVIARVKQAYCRLYHTYVMSGIYTRNGEMLRQLLRATEARYSVGKAAQADVFRAQTQLTILETRVVQIERERRAREAELDSLLGRTAPSHYPDPEEPREAPIVLEDLIERAKLEAPMIARDQKMIERAGAAVNLARKEHLPDVTVNGGYYYMGSMPAMYMLRADVKLPVRHARTRAEVAGRSFELSQARQSYTSTTQNVEYRIRDDYSMIESAEKLMDLYQKTVLPQARLAIQASLAAFETGTGDFLPVLMNQLSVFDYEMSYHEQMLEHHLAYVRLEETTGVELVR